jgi:hypothetical protein
MVTATNEWFAGILMMHVIANVSLGQVLGFVISNETKAFPSQSPVANEFTAPPQVQTTNATPKRYYAITGNSHKMQA